MAEFASERVLLLGANAQGKTSILEAIASLATARSPFVRRDAEVVRFGTDQAIIRSVVRRQGRPTAVDLLFRAHGKRAAQIDGMPCQRMLDWLGTVTNVMFSRVDLDLVHGPPSSRREFLDRMLRQMAPLFHDEESRFSRLLVQRNALIRKMQAGEAGVAELEAWDPSFAAAGAAVMRRRALLARRLGPRAAHWLAFLSGSREQLELVYRSGMSGVENPDPEHPEAWLEAMRDALLRARRQDLARGHATTGPQRDDLVVRLDGRDAATFASTGQRRSLVLALKLAERDLLADSLGEPPLLLLDDVLAELDSARQDALLEAIGDDVQTFVTSTHLSEVQGGWMRRADIRLVSPGGLAQPSSP